MSDDPFDFGKAVAEIAELTYAIERWNDIVSGTPPASLAWRLADETRAEAVKHRDARQAAVNAHLARLERAVRIAGV